MTTLPNAPHRSSRTRPTATELAVLAERLNALSVEHAGHPWLGDFCRRKAREASRMAFHLATQEGGAR